MKESNRKFQESELFRKNPSDILTKRIAFREMKDHDVHYEMLRQKYKAVNTNALGEPSRVSYSNAGSFSKSASSSEGTDVHDKEVTLFDAKQLLPQWAQVVRIGPGLENVGNTCFLNSILQCLLYTPPLAQFLLSRGHSGMCRTIGFCALCEMEKLTRLMLLDSKSNAPQCPRGILRGMKAISKQFKFGRQEDAHEFLCHLLDAMQKSCLNGLPGTLEEKTKRTTLIHNIFGGELCSIVQCDSCRRESKTFDPMLQLSLDIRHGDSLERTLSKFIHPDRLTGSNKYKCEHCKKKVDASKRMMIARAPLTLTIQLKRFAFGAFGGTKINKQVSFPDRLNLAPYMLKDAATTPVVYKLYGVLVHAGGSTHSGHYYSFVKSPAGAWYAMNDCNVSQVKQSTVMNQAAYLLFYVRDQPNPVRAKPERPAAMMPVAFTPPASPMNSSNRAQVSTPTPVARSDGVQSYGEKEMSVAKLSAEVPKASEKKRAVNPMPSPPLEPRTRDEPRAPAKAVVHPRETLSPNLKTRVEEQEMKKEKHSGAPSSIAQSSENNRSVMVEKTKRHVEDGPVISWDEKLATKKTKLDEVIQKERRNFEHQLTDLDAVFGKIVPAKWDDAAPTPVLVNTSNTKSKRPSMMDREYDRGKKKKVRVNKWTVLDAQSAKNPFTREQNMRNRARHS